MSGDVQPRKRKDKKKKKDELGVEEPRGTAAAFGEGDVFMHSQSEHGTGGHWCAKVIFFSLLAVLITLVGLIILENRGLTELEANSVESRYSGVLEGWIEDAPDDDHHDEHTLELKHHDEDDDEHGSDLEHDEEGHDDDDDHDENNEHENDDDEDENDDEKDENNENDDDDKETDQDAEDSEEVDNDNENDDDDNDEDDDEDEDEDDDEDEQSQGNEEENLDAANHEDDIEESSYSQYYKSIDKVNENDDDDDDDDDILQKEESNEQLDFSENQDENDDIDDEEQNNKSWEENKKEDDNDDGDNSRETDDYLQNDSAHEDEEEHEDEEAAEPANVEIETIESEVSDEDVGSSTEEPALKNDDQDVSEEELSPNEDDSSVEDDDVEFLEPDELDELPIVEPITAPKGKPLAEVGESPSTEKPQDTLADEEEYERQQEQLRKEKEQASQGMWLKLTVGGALLVATHAVLRRATASRETETEEDEQDYREETPLSDRRMTLISDPVPPPTVAPKAPEVSRPIEREIKKETPTILQSSPPVKEEKDDEEEIISKPAQQVKTPDTVDRELYSDEEDIDIEEEEDEEEIEPTQAMPQQAVPQSPQTIPDVTKEVTPEPDEDDDDVEIIDEEQLEEELEEEEEISDVDDAELLSRLEEKYGRLPEPERPAQKDGGNSIEDEWPGEPADEFWSEHLEQAQRELRQGAWTAALEKASAPSLRSSARARYVAAQALDAAAEANKDNQLLSKAIAAYLELLKLNEKLPDKKLLEVTNRTLDRIKFRGTYLSAEPVYKLLIRRFPNEPAYRNNLTISLLMANRADLAENILIETLKLWPDDRIALAHHGFILKTLHNRLEDAIEAFRKALEGDSGAANEPRFYYHFGDALLLLGRFAEAYEVHKRGAALGHFLSPSQRSLYNVDRLKSRPWWSVEQTPYSRLARSLENSWKDILREGEAAKALYEKEKEGLKERGDWSQLDLFVRGREIPSRCARAPVTCGIVKSEMAASGCRRGQIKFSMMEPGTHVRPHVGPTNCRLRMHLGLSNTKDTYIRVDQETRQWQTGKVLIFDDSFEHEVWHNGTDTRLVLIVDVWHPDLTPAERRQLPAI